tara:strand:+ start:520 stop:783 length:264 start_codon:yes stop_codon:yes gene_type:complete
MTKKEQTEHIINLVTRNHPNFQQVDKSIYLALDEYVNYDDLLEAEEHIAKCKVDLKVHGLAIITLLKRIEEIDAKIEITGLFNKNKD